MILRSREAGKSIFLIVTVFAVLVGGPILPAASAQSGGTGARALIVAHDKAVLSAELTARIRNMQYRPGDRFSKGDTLVEFDCGRYTAQRDVGKADVVAAEKSMASVEKLVTLNAAGHLDAEIAAAQVDKAKAMLRLYQSDVDRCVLRAPYPGYVVAWHANPHEVAAPGAPLVEILGSEALEIEIIVPSNWLSWMRIGAPIEVLIDETGEHFQASLTTLGADVDPVSQTVQVRAAFAAKPIGLVPGMSGVASLSAPGGGGQ